MKAREQRALLLRSNLTCTLFYFSHPEEEQKELQVGPADFGMCREAGGWPEV